VRKEHEQAVAQWTKAAEAGLPEAMFSLGCCIDKGGGRGGAGSPCGDGLAQARGGRRPRWGFIKLNPVDP
jgi:TPR repeat protein